MPFKTIPPIYGVWNNMKQRCSNPNNPNYHNYGGRGIKVCDRWFNSYADFVADMGIPPRGYSIDRIDNDGDYTIENCRWANRPRQMRNTRRTRKVEIAGETFAAADLADLAHVKTDTIMKRVSKGLGLTAIVSTQREVYPIRNHSGDKAGVAKRVANSRSRTHCRNGHELHDANRKINKSGYFECMQCNREKALRCLARKRQAIG